VAQLRAAGDVIDRHRHDDHQLIYVSAGVLAIQTAAGAWVAAPDRAVWVPAGTWHEHRFYGASSFRTVGFSVAGAPLADDSPVVVAVSGLLRELLVACTDGALPADESRRIRAVVADQLRRARVQPITVPAARDARLAWACDLVVANLAQPRTLAWLARRAGASERTLARLFRTEFGMTYPQWRTNARLFYAMIQLAGEASVTEAAHRCGWATTSAFIDTFRRAMGQTPGSYKAAAPAPAPTAGDSSRSSRRLIPAALSSAGSVGYSI
jgi:AraC-like DNA-binding protein